MAVLQAVELCLNPQKLIEAQMKVRRARTRAPLFDTKLLTQHLERSYFAMWKQYESKGKPSHLCIQPVKDCGVKCTSDASSRI